MVKHAGGILSDGQTVTTTVVADFYIDLNAKRDIGEGLENFVNLVQITNPTTDGNATVSFDIIASDNTAHFTGTGSSTTVLASSRAYTYVELRTPLTSGLGVGLSGPKPVAMEIPPNLHSTGFRYISVRYNVTVGTGTLTGSTWRAFIGPNTVGDARKYYPAGW